MTTYKINFSAKTFVEINRDENNYGEWEHVGGTPFKDFEDDITILFKSERSPEELEAILKEQFNSLLPYRNWNNVSTGQYYNIVTAEKTNAFTSADFEITAFKSTINRGVFVDMLDNEITKEQEQNLFNEIEIEIDDTINKIITKPIQYFEDKNEKEDEKEIKARAEKIEKEREELKAKLKNMNKNLRSFDKKFEEIKKQHEENIELNKKYEDEQKNTNKKIENTTKNIKNTTNNVKDTIKASKKLQETEKDVEKMQGFNIVTGEKITKEIERFAIFAAKSAKRITQTITNVFSKLTSFFRNNTNNNNDNDNDRGMK